MKTYTNHIYGDHLYLPKTASNYQHTSSMNYMDDEEEMEGIDFEQERSSVEDILDFKRMIANWILKIKEGSKLTQTTMEAIIQGVTDLNQLILTRVNSAVTDALKQVGIDPTCCPELSNIFDPNGKYGRPFKDLDTSHQQLQYYKKNLSFVVSRVFNTS